MFARSNYLRRVGAYHIYLKLNTNQVLYGKFSANMVLRAYELGKRYGKLSPEGLDLIEAQARITPAPRGFRWKTRNRSERTIKLSKYQVFCKKYMNKHPYSQLGTAARAWAKQQHALGFPCPKPYTPRPMRPLNHIPTALAAAVNLKSLGLTDLKSV